MSFHESSETDVNNYKPEGLRDELLGPISKKLSLMRKKLRER